MDATVESGRVKIHPLPVRIVHWINLLAVLAMLFSGWRIYNAAPVFDFKFPAELTLGGWLGGALLWHFAAMWLLFVNGLFYLAWGVLSGHFKRKLLPLSAGAALGDVLLALKGKLGHDDLSVYNAAQRGAYAGAIAILIALVVSGIAIWKPVQLHELAALMGGYEGARLLHFFAMAALLLFIAVHIAMVALVPRTFLAMLTGRARRTS